MNCYLCGKPADIVLDDQDGQTVRCPDCGEYLITHRVLHDLKGKLRHIDYLNMRQNLHRQRQSNAVLRATINSETVIWR